MLFIPGTVAKGFQKYRAEIFYCSGCLQPVIMRSRCLMCANALAAFAGENPSWERGRGKSGDNYVVQSQTLFCSYCKRPQPPLREARKTWRVSRSVYAGKVVSFFRSFFFSRIVRNVYWAASVPSLGARQREGAGRGAPGAARAVYGARGPWRPGLARGPSSRRGLGWWPGALAAADSPQHGQERALQLFSAFRVSSALSAPSHQAAIRAPATLLRDCSWWKWTSGQRPWARDPLLGSGVGSALIGLTRGELAILGPGCCGAKRTAGMGDPLPGRHVRAPIPTRPCGARGSPGNWYRPCAGTSHRATRTSRSPYSGSGSPAECE